MLRYVCDSDELKNFNQYYFLLFKLKSVSKLCWHFTFLTFSRHPLMLKVIYHWKIKKWRGIKWRFFYWSQNHEKLCFLEYLNLADSHRCIQVFRIVLRLKVLQPFKVRLKRPKTTTNGYMDIFRSSVTFDVRKICKIWIQIWNQRSIYLFTIVYMGAEKML